MWWNPENSNGCIAGRTTWVEIFAQEVRNASPAMGVTWLMGRILVHAVRFPNMASRQWAKQWRKPVWTGFLRGHTMRHGRSCCRSLRCFTRTLLCCPSFLHRFQLRDAGVSCDQRNCCCILCNRGLTTATDLKPCASVICVDS
jgi:hypothetical protein